MQQSCTVCKNEDAGLGGRSTGTRLFLSSLAGGISERAIIIQKRLEEDTTGFNESGVLYLRFSGLNSSRVTLLMTFPFHMLPIVRSDECII